MPHEHMHYLTPACRCELKIFILFKTAVQQGLIFQKRIRRITVYSINTPHFSIASSQFCRFYQHKNFSYITTSISTAIINNQQFQHSQQHIISFSKVLTFLKSNNNSIYLSDFYGIQLCKPIKKFSFTKFMARHNYLLLVYKEQKETAFFFFIAKF